MPVNPISRRPSRRSLRVAAAGLSAASLLAGGALTASGASAATPGKGAPVNGGVLQWALAEDPLSMSPWGGGSGNDQLYVTRQIFDTLTEQNPKTGKILPFLATKWKANANATAFSFTLRKGVTFSDGTPLTAQVVKGNFDEIVKEGAAANWVAPDFIGYTGTTVTGPLSFTVHFKTPDGPFVQQLSGVDIVGPNTLKIPYANWASGKGVIGSGPFVLQKYATGQSVTLSRRTGYAWGPADRTNRGAAHLSGIDFKITPDPSVRTGVLTSNQVEGIDNVQPQDVSKLQSGGYTTIIRANPGIAFGLTFVQSNPLSAQLPVREAIADAVNSKAVRDAVLSPNFAVATSILSNDTVGYVNLASQLKYDPKKAESVLAKAGWVPGSGGIRQKHGQQLVLALGWNNNFAPNQDALQLIQAELEQVGIKVNLETATGPEFLANLQAGKYALAWGNLSNSNASVLRTNFSSAGSNLYKVKDPTLENDFNKEYASPNQNTQNSWAAKAQQRILAEAYAVPVFQLTTVFATNKSVHGVEFGADSRMAQLTDAWVAAG